MAKARFRSVWRRAVAVRWRRLTARRHKGTGNFKLILGCATGSKLIDASTQTVVSSIDLFSATSAERYALADVWCDGSYWHVRK